jgi:hypothetical protein
MAHQVELSIFSRRDIALSRLEFFKFVAETKPVTKWYYFLTSQVRQLNIHQY